MRSILLALIFVLCFANWIFISAAAKSAMHETTAAVVGLSALVALAAAMLNDAIESSKKAAQKHADDLHNGLALLSTSIEKQTELLAITIAKQTEILGTANSDAFAAGLEVQALGEKSVTFLQNINAATEHTNALLKWIGENQAPPTARPK